VRLANMLRCRMGWSAPSGPDHEVVLSSRLRLARNLAGFPFPGRASPAQARSVLSKAFSAAAASRSLLKAARIQLDEVDAVDRLFLTERHLISPHLARTPEGRGVVVGEREVLSLMVNEEDHLRLQGIDSGLCLEGLHSRVDAADDELGRSLDEAWREDWGFLTACPTNAGTGLRASALVHLPGLGLCGGINRVLDGLSRSGVAVRGLYGEGTRVMGDFYQVSNASTLGPPEEALLAGVSKVVRSLVRRELEARRSLAQGEDRSRIEDLVYRSLGTLRAARMISFEEALQHLSFVRMAIPLGWRLGADIDTVNELTAMARPGHIQMLAGRELPAGERDFLRAELLRKKFSRA
jgi:protein arginine kinase